MASLYCKSNEELSRLLDLDKPFQSKIIYQNLVKGISDFNKMTSLPQEMRSRLCKKYASTLSSTLVRKQEDDSAIKLLIRLEDGKSVECVRLSDGKGRYTACLSSEVGCAMGCTFCKTGTMGLRRNLEAGEIIEQFVHLQNLGEKISHVVFMGMGEPLANFQEVMRAITELHREDGFNISYRKITISTCGLVPGIKRLTELNLPIKLAISLVSADDATRSRIMRVNNTYNLKELKDALLSFQHHNDKRITLEYCMLSNVNTSKESAEALNRFRKGLDCLVNLIAWNPIEELDYKTPSAKEINDFTRELKRLGVNYSLRKSKGRSTSSACGQLATKE